MKIATITTQIDARTGEELSRTTDDVQIIHRRTKKARGFIIVFPDEIKKVKIELYNEGQFAASILLDLLMYEAKLNENKVSFHAKTYSDLMNCSVATLYRCIDLLVSKRLLILHKKHGSNYIYTINPLYSWKGKESDREKIIKELNVRNLD